MKKSDEVPEIVKAAESIERDLQRLEELCHSVGKIRLNSEKSIARAGRTLQEALQQQEQMALGLRVLGEAMTHMQQRQQTAIEGLAARAVELQEQANKVAEHMQRFAELGKKAAEATELLQALPSNIADDVDKGGAAGELPGRLMNIETLLSTLAEEAKALTASADGADLQDISREANSLRQRLDSARARIAGIARAKQAN